MNIVAGLGNPGAEYERSRHNLGFMVVDRLAGLLGLRFNQKRASSDVARGWLDDLDVVLAKPQTYMNLSGRALQGLLMQFGVKPRDLLVVYDDFDLPLGTLRLRERGGPGTHNGMRSVVEALGTTEFPRLRVGIGAADTAAHNYVLSDFAQEEWPEVEAARDRATDAIMTYLRDGLERAMNRFNG